MYSVDTINYVNDTYKKINFVSNYAFSLLDVKISKVRVFTLYSSMVERQGLLTLSPDKIVYFISKCFRKPLVTFLTKDWIFFQS